MGRWMPPLPKKQLTNVRPVESCSRHLIVYTNLLLNVKRGTQPMELDILYGPEIPYASPEHPLRRALLRFQIKGPERHCRCFVRQTEQSSVLDELLRVA